MYILDTSVLRSTPTVLLRSAAARFDIAISPMTAYEIICHLDEENNKKNFNGQRSLLLKCGLPRLLIDPFAQHAIAVGAGHVLNRTRLEDPAIIQQLIGNLKESDTLSDFYSTEVQYSDGSVATCREVANRARTVLEGEERNYVAHLRQLAHLISADYPDVATSGLTDQQLGEVIAVSLRQMIKGYRDEDGITAELLATNVVSSMYFHLGYKAHRTAHYLQSAGPNANLDAIPFAQNDCEDSYIAIHLELFRKDALVTSDKGTLEAFAKVQAAFRSYFPEGLSVEARTIDADTFKNEIQRDGSRI